MSSASGVTSNGKENEPPRSQERVRAPLSGVIMAILLAIGFVAWTGSRIVSATTAKTEVENKRQQEAARGQLLAEAPLPVAVVRPTASSWQPVVAFDGTLMAAQSAGLGFKVGGRISTIRVKVGDAVKAGAVLGTLDATEITAQLRATEAQVRAAEAQQLLAEDSQRRTQAMVERGSLAEATGVQSTQQAALAAAQLDAARAQVALARVQLGNHTLTAPFSGTVTRIPDGIGAVVAPGPAQFELVNTKELRLQSTVSEDYANLLAPGIRVSIEGPHGNAEGELSAVLTSVDPNTRRVPLEAKVKNDGSLRAGSFVRARAHGGTAVPVLELPHEVLRPGTQNEVLVVESEKLAERRIVYAVAKDGRLLVRSGIGADDRVVLSPSIDVEAGTRVAVTLEKDRSNPAIGQTQP